MHSALGYGAAKAIRRMIGYAHVSDIATLDEPARSSAAAAVLRAARRLLLERHAIDTPAEAWRCVVDELGRDLNRHAPPRRSMSSIPPFPQLR